MRCVVSMLPVLMVVASLGQAQADTSRRTPRTASARPVSAGERQLRRLEEAWAQAVIRRDSMAFRRLLHPRFVYTENERVMNKTELIREIVYGTDTVESAGNEDMKVYMHGATAVVTGILTLRGRGASGAFDRRFRYTDTWIQRGGRWQVIAAQDYLLPR